MDSASLDSPLIAPSDPGRRSASAYERACRVFPDGVSRVTIERDPIPRYMARGEGAYLFDLDGRRFLDLNANFTTLIHGHAFAPVQAAIERQLTMGSCFANPTEAEIELAELLCARIPRLERIRFVTTGSEAVMFAVKAARAHTGRSAIAKIEGAYHGAYDWAEVAYASNAENWGSDTQPASTPNYRGMPESVLGEVVALRFNDVDGANAPHRCACQRPRRDPDRPDAEPGGTHSSRTCFHPGRHGRGPSARHPDHLR